MAWYDEAVFYHIYPLGLLGAPRQNPYGEVVHRLPGLLPWIDHIRSLGCNAIYIGPLFESVGHGYETTDYKKLDSRLGSNQDLKDFVDSCHEKGVRVIFDGVFNHTGRDFFAFQDIKKNREASAYRDWYCDVNFWGNNEYNDGFSYQNWGGYNLLVKLNQKNPAVRDYICDVITYWVQEFDVDGIRLDAADVLDFDFMKALRACANRVKPDFWLMGEVIHGDYSRWANSDTLHSVTNYMLHKAFFSGHNDHNYFEIAHTLRYVSGMTGNQAGQGLRLYHFVDNHDVERIATKLTNKAHFVPVHVLLYTLPGIPSLYYGSEFGIHGKKERGSDDSLRPSLRLSDFYGEEIPGELEGLTTTASVAQGLDAKTCMSLISALGKARTSYPALMYGSYGEKTLTTRQYAYERSCGDSFAYVMVNNDENPAGFSFPVANGTYQGVLSGEVLTINGGNLSYTLPACAGEVWLRISPEEAEKAKQEKQEKPLVKEMAPKEEKTSQEDTVKEEKQEKAQTAPQEEKKEAKAQTAPKEEEKTTLAQEETVKKEKKEAETSKEEKKPTLQSIPVTATQQVEEELPPVPDLPYEQMSIPQLQSAILAKMAANGPVDSQMRKTVTDNIWKDSLINWVKSFR